MSWRNGPTRRPTAECQAAFDREGVPSSPYKTVREMLADPQLAHRGAFAEVSDTAGSFRVLNPPFRLSGAPVASQRFAAALGEHTEPVLAELGYDAAAAEALVTAGAVRAA